MHFQRKIFSSLLKNLANNKIIILTGSRQVGKTTLMKMVQESIQDKEKSVFIDMDIVSNQDVGEKLENFLDFLILNGYSEKLKKFVVFIDEFQRVPQMANILKNVYDNYPNIKIFASGSSSLSIKKNIKESLAGRKFVYEIFPLDFEEFIDFKQNTKASEHYNNISKVKSENIILPKAINDLYNEFLIFGGYPEVVLAKNSGDKKQILKSIFDLYIEKDVMTFMGVENIWAYKKLVELLAVDAGQLLNYNNLAQSTEIHNKTVRSYLNLLEDSYLIKIVRPFFSNKGNEIRKSPKIYFQDNGVRNYFLNNFNGLEKRVDKGVIFENYVLLEIIKNNPSGFDINFWRTKQKEEVDFIIKNNDKLIPVEAKSKSMGKVDDYRNVVSFLKEYKQKTGYVVSGNFNTKIEKQKKIINFIPAINFVDRLK